MASDEKKNDVVLNESYAIEPTQTITKVDDAINLANDEFAQKYSPWTKRMFRLYAVLWVAYLCGCLNGYDGECTCIKFTPSIN